MDGICDIEKVSLTKVETTIKEVLVGLTHAKIMGKLMFRFSIKAMFPLPIQFIRLCIKFLILMQLSQSQLKHMDSQLKGKYQQQLKCSRLMQQFDFEHFLLITVKLCVEVMNSLFRSVMVGQGQEQELCAILMKVLLGMTVVPTCYKYLKNKYVDEQMYQLQKLALIQIQNMRRQGETSAGTKKLVTMNAIQSKMQKRKIKNTKQDRPSIEVLKVNETLMRFKEDLDRSLKVQPIKKKQKKKEKYHSLEKMVYSINRDAMEQAVEKRRKKMIHTEQISSSMNMNLLRQNSTHSYSKRDIVLRHSNPSPHLSHRVYQALSDVNRKQNLQLPCINERRSYNPKTCLTRKTKTYWNHIKQQIRQQNQKMLF